MAIDRGPKNNINPKIDVTDLGEHHVFPAIREDNAFILLYCGGNLVQVHFFSTDFVVCTVCDGGLINVQS